MWEEFSTRIVNAINHGLSSTECPLFVSHAGVFRAVIDALQVSSPGINNCELIKFIYDDQANQWRAIRVIGGYGSTNKRIALAPNLVFDSICLNLSGEIPSPYRKIICLLFVRI